MLLLTINNLRTSNQKNMKKITIFTGILLLAFITNGQIIKGTFLIGGQVSYSNTKTKDVINTGLTENAKSVDDNTLVLSVGKAFKDNDIYGISIGFLPHSGSSSIYADGYSATGGENNYSISIYNRKYKKIITDLNWFSEVGSGFSYSHKGNMNLNWWYTYFTPGIDYRLRKRVELELLLPNLAKLSYYNRKISENLGDYTYINKYNYLGLTTSLGFSSFAVGIRIVL